MANRGSESPRKLTRGEKSKIAAKARRDNEGIEMSSLIETLPLRTEEVKKMDKSSILRLAASYIQLKEFLEKDMCIGEGGREDEALISQESSDLEVECTKKIPESPASLFNNSLMLQAFGGFLLFLNKKGKILFVSENVEELLGFSQEDMISHSITEFISPAYYHEIHNHLKVCKHKSHQNASDILSTVHSRNFCVEMKTKIRKVEDKVLRNNSLVMTKWSGKVKVRPSKKSKGYSTVGLLCLCRPVQTLTILEIRMEGQMFMSRHNMDMTYIYCEKRIVTLIGYEPTDLIGKTCYQFHNPLDVKKISSCHSNLLVKGASTSKYYRFLGKSGDWVWMQTQATIIYDTENKAKYVVCMNYIISQEDGEKYLKFEEEQNGIPDPHIHGCIDLTSAPTKPVPITPTDTEPQTVQNQSLTVIQPNSSTTGVQSNSFQTEIQPNLISSAVDLQVNSSMIESHPNSISNVIQPNSVTSRQPGNSAMMTEGTMADWSIVPSSLFPVRSPSVAMTSVAGSMIYPGMDIMDENNSSLNMEVDDEDDLFNLDLEVPPSLLPIEKVKVTSVASLTQNSDPLLCPLSKESNILITTESSPVEPESSVAMDIDNDFSMLDDLLENISHYPSTSLSSPVVASSQDNMETDQCLKIPYIADGIQGQNQPIMTTRDKLVTNEKCSPKITTLNQMLKNPKNAMNKSCQLLSLPSKNLQERPVPSKNAHACQQNLSSGSLLRSLLHRESPPPPKETQTTSSPSPIATSIPLNQNAQSKSKSSFYTTCTSCVSSNQSLLSAVLEGNATLNIPTCKKTVPISIKNANLTSRKVMTSQPRSIQRPDPYKKTFCSHGHSCQGVAKPVYQTINVKTLSDFAFMKNMENSRSLNDSAKDKRFLDNDLQEVDLPDDLLDLHIQYCDGLAEYQTQALLAEFEHDLLSSPEVLLIPDSEEDSGSPNKESYQNYFSDVVPNIDSCSNPYQLPSNQNQDINITSTNQQSPINSNNHMTSCCEGNNNCHKTADNIPPFSNCCQASRSGGLQSPTVSSTQVGKICLSPASAQDEISSSSDSDICEDQNKSKKTVTSSNSIGVQTAYTNSKGFNFPQYSRSNGGQSTKNRMSELEQHLRGYKSFDNSRTTECLECTNIERHSKVTPFLHKLLTGEISRDLYHQVDNLLLKSKNLD